jgi:purine/pyrimidine-nucleoside phosphorylase
MSDQQNEFSGVTLVAKANVFFEGKVVSHTFLLADGTRKTAGLIYPGKFHFGTDQAERMEITAGKCLVKADGQPSVATYVAGQQFEVAAKSGFDIEVAAGLCQYICTFLG